MPILQSSYSAEPGVEYLGQLHHIHSPFRARPRIARGYVDAGYGVFLVPGFGSRNGGTSTDPGEVFQRPSPAVAASATAIIASGWASAAGVVTKSGADLNGTVGATEMFPGRLVTATFSNHADWDATNMTVTGVSAETNLPVTETIAIPNGGNATVTGTVYFKSITSISVPAQSGAGGTATLGIAASTTLTAAYFDGIVMKKPFDLALSANDLYRFGGTALATTADYVDNATLDIIRTGTVSVYTEQAVTEVDPVYVRIASGAGGTHLGAFRKDDDTGTAVLLTNCAFSSVGSAAGIVKLRINKI